MVPPSVQVDLWTRVIGRALFAFPGPGTDVFLFLFFSISVHTGALLGVVLLAPVGAGVAGRVCLGRLVGPCQSSQGLDVSRQTQCDNKTVSGGGLAGNQILVTLFRLA